jgi:O-antigen ligase
MVNVIFVSMGDVNSDVFLCIRIATSFIPLVVFDQLVSLDDRNYRLLRRLFLLSLMVGLVLGLFIFLLGIELKEEQQKLWFDGGSMNRAGGLTANSAAFGYLSGLFIVYVWLDRSLNIKETSRVIFSFSICLGLAGVILSASRAGLLFVLASFMVIGFFKLLTLDRDVILNILFSVFFLFVGSFVLSSAVMQDSEFSLFILRSLERLDFLNIGGQDAFTTSARFSNWPILISVLQDNFLMGLGYKQFSSLYGIYSDNSFLGIAIDGGIFSLLLYVFFWCAAIGDALHKVKKISFKYSYLLGFLIGTLAFSLTVDFYGMWYPAALFFLGYGMIRLSLQYKLMVPPK